MIQFSINEGPDFNVLSTFKFSQNQVYLGRKSGDLWINDPKLLDSHLMLEIIGSDLMVHPQKEVEFYLLNGKRSTTIKKVKLQDKIQFGDTVLQIIAFDESQIETKKEILDRKLNQLIQENSPRLKVIDSLTRQAK